MSDQTQAPRMAYMILETERTEDGAFVVCIAVEGENGYHRTTWKWDADLATARHLAQRKNEMMGISEIEADEIVLSTMRRHQKGSDETGR